jgi:hypothetical protein
LEAVGVFKPFRRCAALHIRRREPALLRQIGGSIALIRERVALVLKRDR